MGDARESEFNPSISSDSDDICILPDEKNPADILSRSMDGAGFTMLDAAGCTYMDDGKNHEATRNPKGIHMSSGSNSDNSPDLLPDKTDSDIEVLISESMYEPNWTGKTRAVDRRADSKCVPSKSDKPTKATNKTPHRMDYGHLDNSQLIEIIREKSKFIEHLEQKLELLKAAHTKIFVQFKEFEDTICNL